MPRLEVTDFTKDDILFGMELTDAEEWHRTESDWKRLFELEPRGIFKAVLDGRDVGVAATITYDKACWIHSVIVRRDMQRMGVGSALVKRCLELAKTRGSSTVKLESVGGCEPFYEQLGFVREFESLRFFGRGLASGSRAERIDESDLAEVCALDKSVTGLDRQRVIYAVYRDAPELAHLLKVNGRMRGYLLGRRGDDRIQIGPCIVYPDRSSYAKELLSAIIGDNQGRDFRACVPDVNPKAKSLVGKMGFKMVGTATRMYLGTKLAEAASVYVIASPEKG